MNTRNALLLLASEQGRTPRIIDSILKAVGAHPDLIDLPRMMSGLLRVLRTAEIGTPITIDDADPHVWREACEWLISLRSQPSALGTLGKQFWFGEIAPVRNPVLSRGVKQFGFPYAALWHAPRDVEGARDFERLMLQLLAVTQMQGSNYLHQQRYAVFLDLRRLCESRQCTIPPVLKIWGSAQDFIAGCRLFSARESTSENGEIFVSICRLVRYSQGDEPPTRSGGGGSRGPRRSSDQAELTHLISEDPRGFILGDPDDPDQLPGYYSILMQPSDRCECELAPDELSSSTEIWTLDDDGSERPYVADKLSQQSIEAHIVRSRQLLPFSYSQFTLVELRDLLFGATQLFEACLQELSEVSPRPGLQLRMEAILLLHIGLWLGQPTSQTVQLTVAESAEDCPDGFVLINGSPGLFSVFVRRPDLVGEDRWLPASGTRPALLRILLPDLAGSSALVSALLRKFPRSSNQVFRYQVAELETEARCVLKLLGRHDPRFTLAKVRNYLFHQLVSDTHDVAAASMLSGVCVPSAQTPGYYLQLSADYLRRVYEKSLGQVLRQVYACAGITYELPVISLVQHGAVGASHCLLPETILANSKALSTSLRKKPSGRFSEMVTWHNNYTLWVLQMFMLSTGCRAIRNPLLYVDEFDPVTDMGAMSDKDSDDRHMSRLVCLPGVLRRQLGYYFRHCAAIARVMTGYLPSDDHGRWGRGFFLFVSESGVRRLEVRPATIRQQMKLVSGYVLHPINAYRKFVRTELAELGCPAEVLAAFMGHWLRGEEPQDRHSSFCPFHYAETLGRWITQLLGGMGWYALRSPWEQA